MPIIGADTSGNGARPIKARVDGDGKEWILARAHGDLTAHYAYVAYMGYDGWRTLALFGTDIASVVSAAHRRFVAFVPAEAIGSGTDGWGQVGGIAEDVIFDAASTSMTAGNPLLWASATVTGNAIGITATSIYSNMYGVCAATGSSNAFDVMLLGTGHRFFGIGA